jgi:hypothetical protein
MHDSHQKAAEYHSLAGHAHRTAAEHHGQEDHLTGHEHSRQALEHSNRAYQHSLQVRQKARTEHGAIVLGQEVREEDISAFAHKLWQARRCPEGSPQEDWFRAVEELRSRN